MANTRRTTAPSRGEITDEEIDEIRDVLLHALDRGPVDETTAPKNSKAHHEGTAS